MAFTTHLKVMTPVEMTGSNIEVTLPSGYRSHVLHAKDEKLSIIDGDSNEFELSNGAYFAIEDPNLQGQKISVTGAAPGYLQCISQKGLAS